MNEPTKSLKTSKWRASFGYSHKDPYRSELKSYVAFERARVSHRLKPDQEKKELFSFS